MANLDRFRATVGAAAVGFARRALDEAVRFAQERVQFGRPIAEFEGIQFKLAEMATLLDAARLLVRRAAASADRAAGEGGHPLSPFGDDPSREASMAKLFATEAAQQIVDEGRSDPRRAAGSCAARSWSISTVRCGPCASTKARPRSRRP
jgi:acyl-CoA dehydrogenase